MRINCLPQQREYEQLLRVEWEVGYEISGKQGCHGVGFLEPHSQQTEHGCAAYSRKEAAPIITYGKVRSGDLNAE